MNHASLRSLARPHALALLLGAGLLVLGPVATAQETEPQATRCTVVVAEGGGLDQATLRTLRTLVMGELRRRGLPVADDPSLEILQAGTQELKALQARQGGRIFVLRVAGRLGAKLPLALEEIRADGSMGASSTLVASSLEECDVVIPRLVDATVGQRPVARTATMGTVTDLEARSFRKRPGEKFWTVGLPAALFSSGGQQDRTGFSLGYMYEAEDFQVGVEGSTIANGNSRVGGLFLQGAWLMLPGEYSPYVGGGLGYLNLKENGVDMDGGLALKATAGLELFRLHAVRLQLGLDLYFPGGSTEGQRTTTAYDSGTQTWQNHTTKVSARSVYAAFHVKFGF